MNDRLLSIGRVLDALRDEFPDVTASKVRFLENEGLISPRRTGAGYRQYSDADIDRLRRVLVLQRDEYLPLRVIAERLDRMDRGVDAPADMRTASGGPSAASPVTGDALRPRGRRARLTRPELLASSGLDDTVLGQLEAHGLVKASAGGYFDEDALVISSVASEMLAFGVEPRHLRTFKIAADREIGLVAQVLGPVPRDADGRSRRDMQARELLALCIRLHVSLVRSGLA